MKFLHAADLHIDSPLKGLDRYEGAPVGRLRGATRGALENLVALALEERVAFLLLAGDVFDGTWKDYSTGLFFAAQMTRLREAGIPVVLVRGNHDAMSAVVRSLRLPENVKDLSPRKVESFHVPGTNAVVHGQSFSQRLTSEDLALKYPDRKPGAFNIGLLHTSLDGREGHAAYAPTGIETLRAKGYDYWALGHVHAREIVATDPWIVYPGNVQGRHSREPGPKGATLVTVDDGTITSVEHKDLDVLRWDVVTVDVGAASDPIDAVDLVRGALAPRVTAASGRLVAARIIVAGASRANAGIRRDVDRFVSELRASAADGFGDDLFLEKVLVQTRSKIDLAEVRAEPTAVGHLARRLAAIRSDDAEIADLVAVLAELEKKLPVELREAEGGLGLSLADPATVRALVDDVEQLLVPRLLEGDGTHGGR